MDVFSAVKNLKSFREAESREVPRKEVGKILEAGRQAPSPANVQSVEFVVVESEHSLELLSEASGDHRLEDVPVAVIISADLARMKRKIGSADAMDACSYEVACVAQNMRLVARGEDVSSCWVTGFDSEMIKQGFSIPEEKEPLGIVGLCYSNSEIESDKKFGLGEVVYYEEYGNYMESVFDSLHWKGLERNREIVGKRFRGFLSRLLGE